MNQTLALLCGVDPMLDDLKVKAGCISIRRSHAPGRAHAPWSLDCVILDE